MNGARVLTTLKDEDVVAAIGVIGDWTFVEYNNTYVGYVSSRYIQLTDTPMATSDPGVTYAPTASPTPSPTPIIVPDDGKYMQVLCETSVNLRSGPGTSYDTLAQLHNGDLVKLLDVNGSWSHVMYGDMEGYVSSSLLTSVVTATAAPSGAPTATPDPEVTPTAPATRQAEVNCDGVLNVRQSASTSSRILGTLRPGDRVTVVSESSGWAQIEYGSGTAYVSAQYIRYIDAPTPTPTPGAEATPTAPAARQAEVNCNGVLNVRQSASTGSRILGTLRPGDRVTVVSESNGWAQIEYGSGTAYVSAQYIRYIDAPIATPQTDGHACGNAPGYRATRASGQRQLQLFAERAAVGQHQFAHSGYAQTGRPRDGAQRIKRLGADRVRLRHGICERSVPCVRQSGHGCSDGDRLCHGRADGRSDRYACAAR